MENYTEIVQTYTKKATDHANEWKADPTIHLVDIIRSVMMHRDGIQTGGHFVQAVCKNDLRGTIDRADATCRQYLNVIVSAYSNAHVNIKEYV